MPQRVRLQSLVLSFVFVLASAFISFTPCASAQSDAISHPANTKHTHKTKKEQALHVSNPGRKTPGGSESEDEFGGVPQLAKPVKPVTMRNPREQRLVRGHSFHGDLRSLPQTRPEKRERPEREDPKASPKIYPGAKNTASAAPRVSALTPTPSTPAPATTAQFDGLDYATWGAGHPTDQNGDVGPDYYIQAINTSVGVFAKADGTPVAEFTFNTLMSQGNFGNLCDTDNFGDPVVLYDTFEDRWIITDFAFQLDGSGNVSPQHVYQCFAVSKSGDPVAGGWNFYSIETLGGLGDYPKFGIWPDGLYMSANMFGYASGAAYQGARVWALNKQQMYAGSPTVQVVTFDVPGSDFTVIPSDARLQTGTPPTGAPNYFISTWQYLNAVSVYKFHVDWNSISLSTFSGPDTPLAATSWPNASVPNAVTPAATNPLDVLQIRAMARSQYSNIGGAESLWVSHTVRRGDTTGFAAPRWYQVDVTGGTVNPSLPQATTWDPDGSNITYRYMPSLAVDRFGDMAIGYTTSNASSNPAIAYAGRLAGDPANTFSQGEQTLIAGTGTQTGNCGGSACKRWGDYTSMTLDPDGCNFWYTNGYFAADGLNVLTRIGKFAFAGCTPAGTGTISGTVTADVTYAPISGATVTLGQRSTTTDVNGNYQFTNLPSGTYPSMTAIFPGYHEQSAAGVVVTDGSITTQDFRLVARGPSGCLYDTTEENFLAGVATNCDLTGTPGDVTLLNGAFIDQQNTTVSNSGSAVNSTTWGGQTFTPSVSGQLTRVDLDLFCSGCTGTTPNITVAIRATSGTPAVPTGSDLATASIAGFASGAGVYYAANFALPATVTAGTTYAVVLRADSNPSAGTYAYLTSSSSQYAGGQRVRSTDSGSTWTAFTAQDLGFKVYIQSGFPSSGTYVSGVKDTNPSVGTVAKWEYIAWDADYPPNTNVQFQVAASDNVNGPFNFVGPDGTAATFFRSGSSISQFNGHRFLKYKAILETSDPAVTPSLQDVSVCYSNGPMNDVTTLTVSPATGAYGGSVDLSATLTATGGGLYAQSVDFTLNGTSVGSAVTDSSGVATLTGVSLSGINTGTYPAAVAASFAGDSTYSASNGSATLTVNQASQTIDFAALADKNYGDADFTVSATATSSLVVSFGATGNCTVTGSTVHIVGAGSCTITASQAGDTNYSAAPDVPQSFNIGKATQSISFGSLSDKTYGDADFTVNATATSSLPVSFGATGNCTVTGSTVHITNAGSCTITASQAGDTNYSGATDVPQSFTIAQAGQSISFGALADKTFGDADFTVSATATSGLPVSFGATGNCTVTSSSTPALRTKSVPVAGATVHIVSAGSCTITASQAGDTNYQAATDVPQSFTINKATPQITWSSPANIPGGTPLSSTQLNATASVPGTFIYNPAAGTVLPIGANTLGVTFNPSDSTNYNNNTASVSITVDPYVPATISSPTPGSTLPGPSVTFNWTTGANVTDYVLYVGTTPGAKDVVGIDAGTATSATVNKIPTTGGTLYVTLYSKISGLFQHVSYTYTQYSGVPATMASPSPGSTLSGSTVTFNWTAGSNVSDYVIYVGTTPGAKDVAGVDAHTNTSATISNIPVNGGTIYVTLYSKIGGLFQNVAYTYTAFSGAPATMTSPTPGATLSGSGVTFNWSAGTNVTEYVIYVGTTPGAKDIAGVNTHSNTSATINNIPTNGATIYVTLYSKIGGLWTPQPYTYVTGP